MFTLQEILQATNGRLTQGPGKTGVLNVSIDSRQVKKGDVFLAIKGDLFDGHDFLKDVVAKGVRAVVVHKPFKSDAPQVNVIQVKDTVRALGDLARFHRRRFKAPVIAVTGSAGKTTTKEMIAAVLSRKYKVLKNEGTQNNHIGVPMTLFKLRPAHDIVVLECGTNQPGDIPWLADVARPEVAVFTNIGESHLEKLKSPQGVLKEKWTLTSFMLPGDRIVLNGDDPFLAAQIRRIPRPLKGVTYGIKRPAQLKAGKIVFKKGSRLQCVIAGKNIELNSCGINNVYNALAAFACGIMFAVAPAQIAAALKAFEFPQGRGQIVRLGRGWLINDAYNANPVSMRGALQTLEALTVEGKKIVVAADMLELGPKARELHRALGRAAVSTADVLITVGRLAAHMADEARRSSRRAPVFACSNVEGAQKALAKVFSNGDAVLVKGSRRMKMEQVVEFLLESPKASLT